MTPRLASVAVLGLLVAGSSSLAAERAARPPEGYTYRRVGGRELKAHVYLPGTPVENRPAILLFHGGGWRIGEPAWLFARAREFAEDGLVAMSIEYRLSNDGQSPADAVEDACAAFAWAREKATAFGIDRNRVAGYGVSAGGHLVAAAATLPSVKGRAIGADERPSALLLFSPALGMAADEYFRGLMEGKGDPAAYSPLEFVSGALPPALLIQGEEDSIVLTRDARAFCKAAEKAGAACSLQVYPKVGHLLTRNLEVQYKDFDSDPTFGADAHRREDAFLASLGYVRK